MSRNCSGVLKSFLNFRKLTTVHFMDGRTIHRPSLHPQQNPELPAQFHLVEHGLIPAPGHIFLSKAPRRLPEIVSAEERSRTRDAHQVNKAELIVLPMEWLSKKQSGRVMPTAMGLGMAGLRSPQRGPLRGLVWLSVPIPSWPCNGPIRPLGRAQ